MDKSICKKKEKETTAADMLFAVAFTISNANWYNITVKISRQ